MSAVLELPGKVIEGAGSLEDLPRLLKERGLHRIGVIADPFVARTEYAQKVLLELEETGIECSIYTGVTAEPSFSDLRKLYRETDLTKGDGIVAIGGGSVIDTSKLLCAMAANPEFAEKLEQPQLISRRGIPLIAAPTTAGTGAEATPNAILFQEDQCRKVGIVSRKMIADTVILDAMLTESMPPMLAACTGFDALAHAMESFTSRKAVAYSDMFAVEAMRLIFENIIPACREKDVHARQKMLLASFYAGVCLVTSSTHIVHAMAYPLAERFHVAHGKGIASLLTAGMRSIDSARRTEIEYRCLAKSPLYETMEEIADILGIERKLGSFGVREEDCQDMARAAMENKRLFANCPGEPDLTQVTNIYRSLL